ncbi:Alpha-1, 6-fucosyltransferase -like protein [Sarcoptes scabiei]|uniref:Alpha-1,6-fucosyltransferase -like protein n=1 Tax=Sarcoptes scabiei TaxID=52283 RepID=A0A834VB47_SARSC|nr:Alpha-1, 6-fucosyltransferase -like protein [Sarcoptes scabiei]
MAISKQLKKILLKLTCRPFVHFIGEILAYLMRPKRSFQKRLKSFRQAKRLNSNKFIIGLHVRRTDGLISKAKSHSLAEYIDVAEDIFQRLNSLKQLQSFKNVMVKRKIYLATDEIDVWRTEVPSFKRKGYQFVGEIEHTKTAAPVQRFQIESYENFLLDVYALSRKDYRVCTLNSHLCRLAYELIQIDRDYDMSQNVISLDDVYYFGGQRPHRLVATVINDNKDKIVPKQLASDLIQDKR